MKLQGMDRRAAWMEDWSAATIDEAPPHGPIARITSEKGTVEPDADDIAGITIGGR